MRIGIAFDLAPADGAAGGGPDDQFEEFDKPETVEAIADVLRSEGHEVVLLGDGRDLLDRVLRDPPEFVWNMAEGQGVGRCREARVPAALEMLGIPYSGSDPLTLAASLDKDIARRLVAAEGVTVPRGRLLASGDDEDAAFRSLADAFPLILKPAYEGSSKGVRARCLVKNEEEGLSVYRQLAREYEQPILIEQFIEGDEVTVGLIGNGPHVEIVGAMRILPKDRSRNFIYSLEVKRDWLRHVEYQTPGQFSSGVLDQLTFEAVAAYQALGCRDMARIDFRIRNDIPYFIEANPLPGLAPVSSDLVILAEGYGIDHADLIRRILRTALSRVGLVSSPSLAPL